MDSHAKTALTEELPSPALIVDDNTTNHDPKASGENADQQEPCPPVPEERKRKVILPSAASAIVTPCLPAKRRRLDTVSPSPKPVSAASASTPSFKDLYGDDEDDQPSFHSITMPSLRDLQSRHLHQYKRRNSVTKFSLQASASRQMSVLEAARMTLEKLRHESLEKSTTGKQRREGSIFPRR